MYKKFKFILDGVLIFFIFLVTTELGLRSIALYATLKKDILNSEKTGNHIKILTIGESTTADILAGAKPSDSWPRQMEAILNQRGYSVKVINE